MVMVPEEPVAVREQIPDDQDIERQHAEHKPVRADDEFAHLNRNEERRFTDGQPAGPEETENQADTFDQRNQAVKHRDHPHPAHVGGRDVV